MKRRHRLRRSRDFTAVREARLGARDELVRLQLRPTDLGHGRVGLVVGRRHGAAVARNRLRRRLRVAAAAALPLQASADFVLTPRPGAAAATHLQLVSSIRTAWGRARGPA
ncbi:MAG: ribonuclease P protein component [Candidatus Dormibacteria bacterium]